MVRKEKKEPSELSTEYVWLCEEFMFGVNFTNFNSSEIREEDLSCSKKEKESLKSLPNLSKRKDFFNRVSHLLDISKDSIWKESLENPSEQDYDRLFLWASERGAELSRIQCNKDIYGGTCLVAKEATKRDTVIAVLPRSLRIGQHAACKRLGIPSNTPDLSALSLFLLDVLLLDKKDLSSDDYYPYVSCLPRRCSNALIMSEPEIDYWSEFGEEYVAVLNKVRSQGDLCIRYILNCLISGTHSLQCSSKNVGLMWAISMILSRTHGFGSAKSRWLTPIFDFCNHSSLPSCTLEGDAFGGLVLKTTRDVAVGEELTIDYMVSEDSRLVATYGFSLLHSNNNRSNN